jgi:hypothetical protein
MQSLDKDFTDLLEVIKQPDTLNSAKSDPVFYFVYSPERMLEIKKCYGRWISRLKGNGFNVLRISAIDLLWRIIDESGRWNDWVELEAEADTAQINEAVRDVLRSNDRLVEEISKAIESSPSDSILLLTEMEALHPFFRTRTIESSLHDKIKRPLVIFYPGNRSGQYGLRFLGFYSVDGNYRSTLLGGI